MITRWLFNSCMRAKNSLELREKRIGTSTLPAPLHSICSIRLLDGFLCCCSREFIRFSICSTKAGTLPSCAASVASDPKSEDSTIVLLLNFGGILQGIACPTMEYAQLVIQNKENVSMFHKDGSHTACQKYVSVGFWSRTYKSMGIGECAGMPGNYGIFELKRFRI